MFNVYSVTYQLLFVPELFFFEHDVFEDCSLRRIQISDSVFVTSFDFEYLAIAYCDNHNLKNKTFCEEYDIYCEYFILSE